MSQAAQQAEGSGAPAGYGLLFAPGRRPAAPALAAALARPDPGLPGASILGGASADGAVELLASGLTFTLLGLPPAEAEAAPAVRRCLALPAGFDPQAAEALVLRPGGHIAAGGALLPVARIHAGLAAQLALRLGATAVTWTPAASAMDAAWFVRNVGAWLAGGPFPALGLAAMDREADGAVVSEGLAYFTGQELRLLPAAGETAADTVKLALRLADALVHGGAVVASGRFAGPDGAGWHADLRAGGRRVVFRRD